MVQGLNQLTPFTPIIETRVLTFDFGSLWNQQTTVPSILSITSISCIVASISEAQDTNPNSKVIGAGTIVSSPTTKQPEQAVSVLVGNLLPNVTYIITCTVSVSDGSTGVLWNYLTSELNS